MDRADLSKDLLRKLGRENSADATDAEKRDVATAVNRALQTMWQAGVAFFLRQSVNVNLVANQAAYTLEASLQEARGPVFAASGVTLAQFRTRAELEDYSREVLGATSVSAAAGTPWGYLIEHASVASPADATDTHAMTLRLVPAPNAGAVASMSPLRIDGVYQCPNYGPDAMTGTLPVPDTYVESILLPLARLEIARSALFSRVELVDAFQRDAADAMALLFGRESAAVETGDVGSQAPGGAGTRFAPQALREGRGSQ